MVDWNSSARHTEFEGREHRERRLREEAEKLMADHPMGCSCGEPVCPQWQADQEGEAYDHDDFVEAYVEANIDEV